MRLRRIGPHSFRRANITWRQEVGGSAIEASKIAGHSEMDITAEYTFIAIARQETLTKAIQDRLVQAAPQDGGPTPNDAQRERLARARKAKQEKAKVVAINSKEAAAQNLEFLGSCTSGGTWAAAPSRPARSRAT
jgi:hypothetical protein